MLKINPDERLSITEVVNQLQEVAAARNVNPKSPITEVGPPSVWISGSLLLWEMSTITQGAAVCELC